ncbi:hypothetical protein U9M73_00460 [Paenibacillus phoenicis]|uniref:Uncharacterized protein n=1 Tax=Paenibacillus phoenicis TaxID=554117 RepID=A0ABU5PEX2_9BACL|nr:hypothetical protein [Paenibacillus phoenicis]MEA3568471.1 hypothetical protein [Paenibacillus phoenicis]
MDGNHQPASMPLHHAIHPGERMTFGSYPHSADGTVQPIGRYSRSYGGFSKIQATSCFC